MPHQPSDTPVSLLHRGAEASIIGLFVLATLVVLHLGASLIMPLVAAVLIGCVLAHIGDRGQQIGVPPLLAGLVLVVGIIVGVSFLVVALAEPLGSLLDQAPVLGARLVAGVTSILQPLASLKSQLFGGEPNNAPPASLPEINLSSLTGFAQSLTPALGQMLVFFAALIFFVLGRGTLRRRAILVSRSRGRRLAVLRALNAAEAALAHYFRTTALIYLGLALATMLIAWSFGLTKPAVWATLVFVASFVPIIGPLVVAASLATAGLVLHGTLAFALLPAACYLLAHIICDNIIVPAVLGRRFELNIFVVFTAIVFWTWMWGAVGAFLALPFLIVARTILFELRDKLPTLPG